MSQKIQGIAMLLIGALLFWLPHHLEQPGMADGRIIVATPRVKDGIFDHTVIVVLHHDGYNAAGFILNKPSANAHVPSFGGPVTMAETYTLHSADVRVPNSIAVPVLKLAYTQGPDFAHTLSAHPPREYVVLKGYASWGFAQLTREINDGQWKVIAYDDDLAFHTDPAKMWDEAMRKPSVVE